MFNLYLTVVMSPADISHSTKRDDPYLQSLAVRLYIYNNKLTHAQFHSSQEIRKLHKVQKQWKMK